jgi:hypothetical protein
MGACTVFCSILAAARMSPAVKETRLPFSAVVSYNKEARTLRIGVFITQQPIRQEVFSP